MKKVITTVIILITINVFSQTEKFKYTIDGLNPKYLVEEIDSINQNELYIKTLNWVKESFINTDEVIQTTIENEKIRFKGFTDNSICFGKGSSNCNGLTYIIDISFKDGKYKFEPISLSYYVELTKVDINFHKGVYWDKKGNLRGYYQNIPSNIENLFNNLNSSLKSYVSSETKKDDW